MQQWRKRRATGDMIVVRYADDTIVGFQHRREAERFLGDLKDRLAQFALSCICAALGSDAVQLPVAGMGDDPWLRGVGGRADPGPARGLRDRCRFRPLHLVARDRAPPPPGGPSAAAGVVPPKRFGIETNWQLSVCVDSRLAGAAPTE